VSDQPTAVRVERRSEPVEDRSRDVARGVSTDGLGCARPSLDTNGTEEGRLGLSTVGISLANRLSAVTTTLRPGEITAICGPNGAGKSSLLQCLAGLWTPDSGRVELGAADLAALHPRSRAQAIGYLPQEPEVAWDVAVRTLVALGRLPHRDRGEAQVSAVMRALDLERFAHRPVSHLSGGERARALLARVLAGEPTWILADEPLAALDLAHQLALLGHLRREAQRGTGVALVLHDLALAMNHADRVLVLEGGRVAADGAPEEALSAAIIGKVWGVPARWLGEPGARALILNQSSPFLRSTNGEGDRGGEAGVVEG
jgi:iron complex transport system ATP-binding protein